MTPSLRLYQQDLYDAQWLAFEIYAMSVLVVLATGGGKTVLFTKIAADEPGHVWIVAHRKELIYQASKTLKNFGVQHGIVKANVQTHPNRRVQVASVQSLNAKRMANLPKPSLIIIDEAHHALASTYRKIIEANPQARILGVTATPCRTNGAGLGEVFRRMILGPSPKWLTENGYLCPAKYFAPPPKVTADQFQKRGGDYSKEEVGEAMDKPVITGDAIEHYRNICDGVPMIVFCATVDHAKHVAEEYRNAGYRAESVDGDLADDDRDDRIQGLGSRYDIITSCELIGEGLDVPCVVAVQLLRHTASLVLHLQQIGRALRPMDGKETAYVLDHVENVKRHGFATTERTWSLEGESKRTKPKTGAVRICEKCFLAHESPKACPHCGHAPTPKVKLLSAFKTVEGKLVEILETPEQRSKELRESRSMAELIAFAKARKYKRPHFWARKVYFGRPADVNVMPRY